MKYSFKKHTLIAGTLLLTFTGFISRILGFFYRIYLSRTIGAEGLGIFNMMHPIFGVCFAICAGSIQTAISQIVASNAPKGKSVLKTGLTISLSISVTLVLLIIKGADFLAAAILMEPRCAPMLPILALSVPFSAIHACINGYYYGIKKTGVPAFSQVFEQIVRIGSIIVIADVMAQSGKAITVSVAVFGLLIGEFASCLYTVLCFNFFPPNTEQEDPSDQKTNFNENAGPLMTMAAPLMGNRLVLNLLASAEAIWIPSRLIMFGMANSEAISIYGVLTGMALPFILFPSTITNSMAVLLLPTVAEAQSDGNETKIQNTITMSIRYSLYMGIFCIGIFTLFGSPLGESVYHNSESGFYMTVLAWLCPFLYLATTMGSILNGLGKTSTTFVHNVIAMLVRLAFVLFGIPQYGIIAYLWGILTSELVLSLLHLISLRMAISFPWNAWEMIVKPVIVLLIAIGIYYAFFNFCIPALAIPIFAELLVRIGFLSCCYGGILLLIHISS